MYRLGILKEADKSQSTFINELLDCTTFETSLFNCIEDNEQMLSEMNIILIEEGSATNFESICKTIMELRKTFQGFIWIVSKDISDFSQMIYYQLGADGISNAEKNIGLFQLQLKNLLKHTSSKEETKDSGINAKKSNDFTLNEGSLSLIIKDGFEIFLTKLEYLVLRELFDHLGETLTYEDIFKKIWVDKKNNKTVEVKFNQYRITNIIFHLRKKFEEAPGSPDYIKTVRSKGYKLELNRS